MCHDSFQKQIPPPNATPGLPPPPFLLPLHQTDDTIHRMNISSATNIRTLRNADDMTVAAHVNVNGYRYSSHTW